MAQTVYKRQLVGDQSGVQVNLPCDMVERMLADAGDQSFAAAGRFTRGRIDRPFAVSASKMARYLGKPKSIRANPANETYLQMQEAFEAGAAQAVVSRIVSASAKNLWLMVKANVGKLEVTAEEHATGEYLFALQIADGISEGVYVSIAQGETHDAFDVVIREREKNSVGDDIASGEVLYEFSGSLKDGDDFIGDVAAKYYTDWLAIQLGGASVDTELTAFAGAMQVFSDSGEPDAAAYQKAAAALGKTNLQYRYILGDVNNTVLVNALLKVAQQYNRIMVQDISGKLSPEAAASWKNTFQYDAQGGMYCLWIWSPITRQDPTGAGGIAQFGTAGQKIGRACARNAILNGFGLPELNRPIAGKDFMLTGMNVSQTYFPDDAELAMLAKNHINPVQFAQYHDGSGFVWDDSFSGAKKNGISRLENAVEISQWVQEKVGLYARGLIQKPMTEAIRLMSRFVEDLLQAMQASDWLTPSTQLGGKAYAYTVSPSERNPETDMMVVINIAIDGVVRRIFVSQNMYSRS